MIFIIQQDGKTMSERYKAIDIGLPEYIVLRTYAHLQMEEILELFEEAIETEDYEAAAELKAEAESRGYDIESINP